jgi:pimeloyl-ACP methyl ester carboxylesterase
MNKSKRRFHWLCALSACVLAVIACNFPTTSYGPDFGTPPATLASATQAGDSGQLIFPTKTNASPTPGYQPVFNPAPCAFPIPPGYSPECGYLVVPENRSAPTGAMIQLHVAIFRSTAEGPDPNPLVHLSGGPGSSSLDTISYLFNQGLNAVIKRRDFIFFDQRGTGYSQPRLDCPERNALTPALLDGSLSGKAGTQAIVEAFQRCRERLTAQGIDLSAYNSAASASDINDLRIALRVERLDLYGDSYGTRLALTVLRDFPQAVRSVVLDSTYPLEVNLYTALAPNAQRSFTVLFEACAADPTCSANYPDLRNVFYNLVNQLNNSPVTISIFAGGAQHNVRLTGDLLMDVLFVGMYNPAVTGAMPKMIYQVWRGEYAILNERLGLYFDTSTALGMNMSVQCAEEVPFNTPTDAGIAAQGLEPAIAAFFPQSVEYLFIVCQSWTGKAPAPRENQPVTSDTPALVLAGEFDPITPPEWGQTTVSHLSQATYYEFRGNGHWVTRSSTCALDIMLKFLDDPAVTPESACLQSPSVMYFAP